MAENTGVDEWRIAVELGQIDVGAEANQFSGDLDMSLGCRQKQRGLARVICFVGIRSLCEQAPDRRVVSCSGGLEKLRSQSPGRRARREQCDQ